MSVDSSNESLKELLLIAKDFLKLVTGDLDKYTEEKGIIRVEENRVILFTASHIQFAKYGRGPGKKPPFENILEFVKKENIKFEGTDERGTAFAIQASIGKNGTKGYTKNAPNALEEALNKNFEQMNTKMSEYLEISFQKEVDGIFKKLELGKVFKI
jgi:hypothetical protein